MKKLSSILLILSAASASVAQQHKAVIVAGKVLSTEDSLLVKELYYSGLREKTIQNYQLSSDYFSRVIQLDPANDAALYELASINHAKKNDKEAEELARKAVTVEPENEWYWLLLADIYKRTSNMRDLVPVFDELIAISPEKEDYYFDKANALLLQNETEKAEQVYTLVEKKFGVSDDLTSARQRIYQKQGNSEKAAVELENLIKNNPSEVKNYIELSQIYSTNGNLSKARQILEEAKKIDPSNVYVRLSLADVYRAEKKNEDAFIELKSAFSNQNLDIDNKVRIVLSFFPDFKNPAARAQAEELSYLITESNPGDPKGFSVYGDVLFQENKLKEAAEAYRKSLKLNNQTYMIWEQLLRIDLGLGDGAAAIKDGEEALTYFPNQAPLYLYTGIGYAQKGNHARAVTYLKNASSIGSEDKQVQAQTWASLGDSYNALKQFQESDAAYEKALQIDPDNTYTLNNYAYYLSLRNENLDKAAQMSLKTNQIDQNNASFEDTYAWILFKQKKFTDARKWMEKALSDDQSKSSTQVEHYGDILYQLGEKDQALKQWIKAKEYGGSSQKLQQKIDTKTFIE
ncbi:tetratricopeptide repeat protein [Pedobacter sp. HMF7647]|uniref:Tetratricopeptide repeat protein n=1 Tax=Hufsiella arboris TaxID=2695275 RepID=A0A7K1YBJ8_9SPHI|nr:tetratricopeptide repeat protein [Hufsiella arboris]MXV51741.1 tetratricopeptide repeat protein [Hufsiella arboris]